MSFSADANSTTSANTSFAEEERKDEMEGVEEERGSDSDISDFYRYNARFYPDRFSDEEEEEEREDEMEGVE